MTDSGDEYRAFAAECVRIAEDTRDENDKRGWLRLAETWLRMIRDQQNENKE